MGNEHGAEAQHALSVHQSAREDEQEHHGDTRDDVRVHHGDVVRGKKGPLVVAAACVVDAHRGDEAEDRRDDRGDDGEDHRVAEGRDGGAVLEELSVPFEREARHDARTVGGVEGEDHQNHQGQ